MSWTLTTSTAAVAKAGLNANSSIIVDTTTLAKWSDEAEGRVEAETRRTWVSNYADLSDGIKGCLSDCVSSLVAMQIISYDMSGYTSRQEAGTMLDVQDERYRNAIKLLSDFKSNTLQTP